MPDRVGAASHVTLHYRLGLADGTTLVSTFGAQPATFQLGVGQLAEPFERCLEGLAAGVRAAFALDQAFGPRIDALVQRAPLGDIPAGTSAAPGAVLALTAPGRQPLAARVLARDAATVTLDFNHPLAGQSLVFEAEIIGIL